MQSVSYCSDIFDENYCFRILLKEILELSSSLYDFSDVVFDNNISLERHLYEKKYIAINIPGFNICALNVILFDF